MYVISGWKATENSSVSRRHKYIALGKLLLFMKSKIYYDATEISFIFSANSGLTVYPLTVLHADEVFGQ